MNQKCPLAPSSLSKAAVEKSYVKINENLSRVDILPPHVARGGTIGPKINFLKVPKWILLWFQYIRSGKKEFLDLESILTLHIGPEILHFLSFFGFLEIFSTLYKNTT